MTNSNIATPTKFCFKDTCLQIGVWGVLVVGFLVVCVAVPMMALNI